MQEFVLQNGTIKNSIFESPKVTLTSITFLSKISLRLLDRFSARISFWSSKLENRRINTSSCCIRQSVEMSSNLGQVISIRLPTGIRIFHSHSSSWVDSVIAGLLMVPVGAVYTSLQPGTPAGMICNSLIVRNRRKYEFIHL